MAPPAHITRIRLRGVVALVAAALALWLAPAPSAPAFVVHCGETITKSIDVSNDISDCPGDGLDIGADGLLIRLLDHKITAAGPAVASGINFQGHSHVTIVGERGNRIRGFGNGDFTGGLLIDGDDNKIQHVTTIDNVSGVFVAGNDNVINDSTQRGGRDGVNISPSGTGVSSQDNTVSHDYATGAAHYGVTLSQGGGNVVRDSTSAGNGLAGIHMFRQGRPSGNNRSCFPFTRPCPPDTIARNMLADNGAWGLLDEFSQFSIIKANIAVGGPNGFVFVDCFMGFQCTGPEQVFGNKARLTRFGYDAGSLFTGVFRDNRAER